MPLRILLRSFLSLHKNSYLPGHEKPSGQSINEIFPSSKYLKLNKNNVLWKIFLVLSFSSPDIMKGIERHI